MDGLALALHGTGRIAEAVHLHEETLNTRKSLLDPEHPDIFISMEGLASSLCSLGQEQGAWHLYNDILTARTRILGVHHPDTIRITQILRSQTETTQGSDALVNL